MTRRLWRAIGPWTCLTIGSALFASCEDKDGNFFIPTPFGPLPLNDVTIPIILNKLPATNLILSEREINADFFDPPGASGEPVSGINPASVRALFGPQSLPILRVGTGNTYNVDISSIGEGQRTINYEALDLAGNRATATQSFTTDWTAPRLTWSGLSTGTSSGTSTTINLNGTYSDDNAITQAILYVRRLANGQCLPTGDLVPTGTAPGTVTTNRFDLGLNASTFNLNVVYTAPNNSRPFTDPLCFHYHGEDAARDRMGNPRPNITDRTWRFDQTWTPAMPQVGNIGGRVAVNGQPLSGVTVTVAGQTQTTDVNGQYLFTGVAVGSHTVSLSNLPLSVQCNPTSKSGSVTAGQTTTINFDCTQTNFTVTLFTTYVHIGPGNSNTCVRIVGASAPFAKGSEPIALENIAGASYTVQWTGPGTVGSTQRSGTLNSSSEALDRQPINQFGSYTANVSVTYQGVTKQATGSVTVGGTQGTCPAP